MRVVRSLITKTVTTTWCCRTILHNNGYVPSIVVHFSSDSTTLLILFTLIIQLHILLITNKLENSLQFFFPYNWCFRYFHSLLLVEEGERRKGFLKDIFELEQQRLNQWKRWMNGRELEYRILLSDILIYLYPLYLVSLSSSLIRWKNKFH